MNWKLGGRPVHSPLLKLFVLTVLLVWLPLTLPLHLVIWAFNGDGFIKRGPGRRWNYEPPPWACIVSALCGTIVLLWVLL